MSEHVNVPKAAWDGVQWEVHELRGLITVLLAEIRASRDFTQTVASRALYDQCVALKDAFREKHFEKLMAEVVR